MDIFIHVPKTGGSTIRTVLARQYGVEHIMYVEPTAPGWDQSISTKEFLERNLADRRIGLITGHHPFGLDRLLNTSCRYFSMLRDPVDRSISDYYYAFQFAEHRHGDDIRAGKLGLEEYLENPIYVLPNAQSHLLSGIESPLENHSDKAIENVSSYFAAVGTSERFDESLLLIARALGWQPPFYLKKNVTKLGNKIEREREELSAKMRQRFKGAYKEDYALYDFVDRVLSAELNQGGAMLDRALESFREIQHDIFHEHEKRIYDQYNFDAGVTEDFANRYGGSGPYHDVMNFLRHSPPKSARTLPNDFDVKEYVRLNPELEYLREHAAEQYLLIGRFRGCQYKSRARPASTDCDT